MKHYDFKKTALRVLVFVTLVSVVLFAPLQAHAAWSDPSSWIPGAIGAVVQGVMYLINFFIGGVVLGFLTWMIGILLQINNNVVTSAPVQAGFVVTLSLANLGFVLAIVVIAIMTIFRNQTYGMKKTLGKLIVAAILVNFSLVIAGTIINFTGSLTNYLMTSLPGQGGGYTLGTNTFASSLSAVFQPQQFLNPQDSGTANVASSPLMQSWQRGFSSTGGWIASLITPFVGLLFSILNLALIAIVLATFGFMLLIRYITLAFCLILMPLAWLAWIFPGLSHHWSNWWKTFLRQAFFAPIVVFFLWLVIRTGAVMRAGSGLSPYAGPTPNFSSTAPGIIGAISNFFGGFLTPLFQTALNDMVLIGLTVGGLYAANKMSIVGAGAGLTAAKGAAGWAGGRAMRYAGKGTTRAFNRFGGKTLTENMQKYQGGKLAKITGAAYGTRLAGRGLDMLKTRMGGEKLVEQGKKDLAGLTDNEKIKAFNSNTLTTEQQMAVMEEMKGKDRLTDLDLKRQMRNKDMFDRFDKGKLFKEIKERTGGFSEASDDASEKINKETEEEQESVREAETSLKKVSGKANVEEIEKLQNEISQMRQVEAATKAEFDSAVKEHAAELNKSTPNAAKVGKLEAKISELNQRIPIAQEQREKAAKRFADSDAGKTYNALKASGEWDKIEEAKGKVLSAREALEAAASKVEVDDYRRNAQGEFVDVAGNVIEDPEGKGKKSRIAEKRNAVEVLRMEQQKTIAKLTPEKLRNLATGLFKGYNDAKPFLGMEQGQFEAYQREIFKRIAQDQPGAISRISSKLGDVDFDNFQAGVVRGALHMKVEEKIPLVINGNREEWVVEDALKSPEAADALRKHLKIFAPEIAKAIEGTLSGRLLGYSYEGGSTPAAPGAPAPTPPPPASGGTTT